MAMDSLSGFHVVLDAPEESGVLYLARMLTAKLGVEVIEYRKDVLEGVEALFGFDSARWGSLCADYMDKPCEELLGYSARQIIGKITHKKVYQESDPFFGKLCAQRGEGAENGAVYLGLCGEDELAALVSKFGSMNVILVSLVPDFDTRFQYIELDKLEGELIKSTVDFKSKNAADSLQGLITELENLLCLLTVADGARKQAGKFLESQM